VSAPSPLISQREALEAAWPYGQAGRVGAVALLVAAGYPRKAAVRKLEGLAGKDLVDYGVSVGYCWRTEKGERRLAELREVDVEIDV
jgi:hypothetical protein